ncbi:MAG: YfiR family protein [Nitrosomonas ureae]
MRWHQRRMKADAKGTRYFLPLPWRWRDVAALVPWILLGLSKNAVTGEFDEYAIKAAYLYNFAKFVEWPTASFADAQAPLTICVAGNSPFGSALEAVAGKRVAAHPVEVRYLPTPTRIEQCHIAFLSRTEQPRLKPLLAQLAGRPVLTVSDISDFAQGGGMIGLVEAEQRIHFNINLDAARQADLKLSSQLLKLATIVD